MSIGLDIDLDVDVDDILYKQLYELEFAFTNEFLTWFLGVEFTQYLQERAGLRFKREGDDASGKWKPLAEQTRQERRALGFNPAHPINVRTGELEDWVMQSSSTVIGAAGVHELAWPSDLPPAGSELEQKVKTAQMGRRRAKTSVSKRPVVAVNETDLVYLMNRFAMHLKPGGVTFGG